MKNNKACLYILFIVTASLFSCKKDSIYVNRRLPETTIAAGDPRLASNIIHLSKDTAYILGTNLRRDSGQTLSIEAGTLIKVMDRLSIVINPGATIEAKGDAGAPIVFTSSADKGGAGPVTPDNGPFTDHYWSGIAIYGDPSGSAGTGSGTLSYVRIEFAGGNANSVAWPSLLLQNVNRQTTLENIQVSYAYANSSFEFYGGDCNARNLVSYASGHNDFYLHQGYKGMLQGLLAYRQPLFPFYYVPYDFAGMYISDVNTSPAISNLTVLGPDLQTGTSTSYTTPIVQNVAALVTTGGCQFHVRNSVLLGFPKQGWSLDNNATALSIANGQSDLIYSILHCNDSLKTFYLKPGTYGSLTSSDFKNFMLQPSFNNEVFLNSSQFMLTDPFNYDVRPDPLPRPASPLLSGAKFDGLFTDEFFQKVNYRGALGTDNWLKDWTNFLPLQTNYNN